MRDIDQLLAQIGKLPLDPRLAAIDGAVFAGLADAARPALPRAGLAAIAGVAMLAGVVAAGFPAGPGRVGALDPLGTPRSLAPSTLLGGGW